MDEDADFGKCFDVLQRIGESARSTLYAFVLIFGALLLWALNAVVYPAEQQRLGQVKLKQAEMIECLIASETPGNAPEECAGILKDTSLDYQVKLDMSKFIARHGGKIDLFQIDSSYLQHEIQYQLDKSSEMAQFHVPIIGISSDRTWLWLVNLTLGPLFYYILKDTLSNMTYLLGNLYEKFSDKKNWMMLLSTTQILSSSTQQITIGKSHIGSKSLSSFVKITMMCLIFFIPIIVSLLLFYDWYSLVSQKGDVNCLVATLISGVPPIHKAPEKNAVIRFICHFGIKNTYSGFFKEPEFLGGMLTIPLLFFEIVLFSQICKLIKGLSGLHQKIRIS